MKSLKNVGVIVLIFGFVVSGFAPILSVSAEEIATEPVVEVVEEVVENTEEVIEEEVIEEEVVEESTENEEETSKFSTLALLPEESTTATVVATKIICDSESDLPNWAKAEIPLITSTTATDFVASHPNCEIVPWTFQWAPSDTGNPGDQVGVASEAVWTSFSGSVSVSPADRIWVREQFDNNYIPFYGITDNPFPTPAPVSAEFYCNNNIYYYDNYEWIDNTVAGETYHCIAFNVPISPNTATVIATKIICDSESDLPNWGAGGPNITSSTADEFLASHPNCHKDPNWKFAWSENGVGNPGDNVVGTLGAPWNTFVGSTQVPAGNLLWVREEFQNGYIPFSGLNNNYSNSQEQIFFDCNLPDGGQTCAQKTNKVVSVPVQSLISASYEVHPNHCSSIRIHTYIDGNLVGTTPFLGWNGDPDNRPMTADLFSNISISSGNHVIELEAEGTLGGCNIGNLVTWGGTLNLETETDLDYSAELYCHTDVLNYDNWDWIDPIVAGETYNCVGFNVLEDNQLPQCSDSSDNDGDGFSDENDPGCHTDGDVTNNDSYDPNDNDETNEQICRVEVLSDTTNKVNGTDNAVLAWDENPAWTASIPGASWIWDTYQTTNPTMDETRVFSKTFFIPNGMTQGYLKIAADNEYKVSINSSSDVFVGTDSNDALDHNFTITGQDFYDALPYLAPGLNTISFEVKNLALEGGTIYNNPAGLMYSLEMLNENCGNENLPPVANAGVDQTLTLPTNSTNLDGSLSSDSDGTIVSYVWDFVSGPTNVDPNDVVNPNLAGLVAGTYVFQLTVTDDDGATGTDTVSITVNEEEDGGGNPACSDGEDNDGDGDIDYPEDEGCEDSQDNSEDNRRTLGGGGIVNRGQVLGAQTDVCDFAIDTYMRRGHNNDKEQVKVLQGLLNKYVEANLAIDGFYGPKTEAAVNAFQVKYRENILDPWNIENPTGIFFRTSLVQAKNLECPDPELPIPENLINWSQSRGEVPAPLPVPIPLSYNYFFGI